MSEGDPSFFQRMAEEHAVEQQKMQMERAEFESGFRALVADLDDFQLKILLTAIVGAGDDVTLARFLAGRIVGHFEFVRGVDAMTLESP